MIPSRAIKVIAKNRKLENMNSLKKNAIWFSRHTATDAQKHEAFAMGYILCQTNAATRLAEMEINRTEDLQFVVCELQKLMAELDMRAVFGVFAAPMQAYITRCAIEDSIGEFFEDPAPCFIAWNVKRTKEGEKPTFEHKQFVLAGMFTDAEIDMFLSNAE